MDIFYDYKLYNNYQLSINRYKSQTILRKIDSKHTEIRAMDAPLARITKATIMFSIVISL
jgi:hypothetical protein